jgi:hypothetical protein
VTGYSGKPLVEKLGLRAPHRLQLRGAPPGIMAVLEPLPTGVNLIASTASKPDCILLFASSAADLHVAFPKAAAAVPRAGVVWVAWPKKAAKVPTDLTESEVRRIGLAAGLVDVKVCAVTEIWSGLKFVRRLRDR